MFWEKIGWQLNSEDINISTHKWKLENSQWKLIYFLRPVKCLVAFQMPAATHLSLHLFHEMHCNIWAPRKVSNKLHILLCFALSLKLQLEAELKLGKAQVELITFMMAEFHFGVPVSHDSEPIGTISGLECRHAYYSTNWYSSVQTVASNKETAAQDRNKFGELTPSFIFSPQLYWCQPILAEPFWFLVPSTFPL